MADKDNKNSLPSIIQITINITESFKGFDRKPFGVFTRR